jgi:hypothetical protein
MRFVFGTIGGFCTLEAAGSLILFLAQPEGTSADIHASETVRLQHDVERLIPGHVDEPDGYPASNVVGDYDVLAADLREHAQDIDDVSILEIESDLPTGVDPFRLGPLRLGVRRAPSLIRDRQFISFD